MFKLGIKTYMIIFLLFLAVAGIYAQKDYINLPLQIFAAVFTAASLDSALGYLKSKKFNISSSSVITGLIVGMVLASGQSILYYILAASFAIISKHLIKFKNKHIFNPANIGLLLTSFIFGASVGWWHVNAWLVIIPGIFIAFKIKRLHLIISYLSVITALLVVYSLYKQGEVFDYFPIINLYFVFVMLIEPKTSPIKLAKGIIFGSVVGLVGFLLYVMHPTLDYLLVSLAVGNLLNFLGKG